MSGQEGVSEATATGQDLAKCQVSSLDALPGDADCGDSLAAWRSDALVHLLQTAPRSGIGGGRVVATYESRWLIERPVEGRAHPEYWDGSGWTDDPWKAQAFVTREDGERRLRADLHPFIPAVVTAKVVSHGFEVGDEV